jgi:periplasmic copper chaperone A
MRSLVLYLVGPAGLGAAALMVILGAAPAAERLFAENAWVPWAPPAIKVHAAYMTVANRSDDDQVIVGADSPDYERVELHASSVRNGLSEMRAVDRIAVPARKQVAFAPGGMHIMLINPKRTYAVDDRVSVVLRLQGGEKIETAAVVRRRERAQEPAHHHHGHHR